MLVFFWSVFATADKLAGQACHTFWFWAFDFDFCTPVGSGSLELRLYWICTSEEDKWLIFWDSVKSDLLTRGKVAKATGRKWVLWCPHPRAHTCCTTTGSHPGRAAMFFLTSVYWQRSSVCSSVLWWQKSCQGPHTLRFLPVPLLCPFVLFPSIRFIVKLKPNQQSCVLGVGSLQINLGMGWGGLGWG